MTVAAILGLAAAAWASGPGAAGPGADGGRGGAFRTIQIGIVQQAAEVVVVPGDASVLVEPGGERWELPPGREVRLRPSNTRSVRFGSRVVPNGSRIEPADARAFPEGAAGARPPASAAPAGSPGLSATARIGGHRYAGKLIIQGNADGTLSIIDELDMEEYLVGVLPVEMEHDWPLEALKAQAVTARTYAYYNFDRFRSAGFDLGPDTRSQVYKGIGLESPAVRKAVASTKDEVLGYAGKLLNAYYHSCCGGHTTTPASVWGKWIEVPRPLKGVRDRYCRHCPHARWSAYFADADVLAALAGDALADAALDSLAIGRRDPAGFVQDLRVHAGGRIKVDAKEFRKRLGPQELKSLKLLRVIRRSKGVEFVGSGRGHGVGLCQWGARYQAEKGRGYEEILSHYFPGAVLSVVSEE
ncbi:MAG: SpoIID/LytB domain-containing protein [Elusimicrobia bacterium]|nr:SpoIID/LytB domain-containing protein [Elusimicrobiota bacterium]